MPDLDIAGYDFPTSHHAWRGCRLHYVDTADRRGPPKPAIVLLHGNPTWSFLYRTMIPALAQRFRVIAPDLIGFGRSTSSPDPGLLTIAAHVASIIDLLTALDAREAVLVGQDWGGPIVSAAAATGDLAPRGIVLMNTYLPGQSLNFGAYSLAFHRPWSPLLVRRLDLLRRLAFRFGFHRRPTAAALAAYRRPHREPSSRAAILALLQAVPDRADVAGLAMLEQVDSFLRSTPIEKLLVFSDRDPIFPHRQARRLAEALPAAHFELVRGAGHFLQEDAGPEVAELILAWARTALRPR